MAHERIIESEELDRINDNMRAIDLETLNNKLRIKSLQQIVNNLTDAINESIKERDIMDAFIDALYEKIAKLEKELMR